MGYSYSALSLLEPTTIEDYQTRGECTMVDERHA